MRMKSIKYSTVESKIEKMIVLAYTIIELLDIKENITQVLPKLGLDVSVGNNSGSYLGSIIHHLVIKKFLSLIGFISKRRTKLTPSTSNYNFC